MALGIDSDTISAKVWLILGVILLVFILGLIFLAPKALKMSGWT
jgi:hypothetical protein